MSLWDPVLDGPSKRTTFQQRIIRRFGSWADGGRWAVEEKLQVMVRAGRVSDAINEARTSEHNPCIGLSAIAVEQARMHDAAGALATAGLIGDPNARAGALLAIAEECRQGGDSATADAILASAHAAAMKIRAQPWRHWQARRLAEIGLVRFRLGQVDAAREACRLALGVAEEQKGETRNQTLADITVALCLVGDLDAAAAALQRMGTGGGSHRAVQNLAAAHIAAGSVGAATKLLANAKAAARFGAFLRAGRFLAREPHSDGAEDLAGGFQEIDRLGTLIGRGSALQDLGRFAEAAKLQQTALQLEQKLAQTGELPDKDARPESIAEDLALNLARSGETERARGIADLITESSAKRRTIRAMCVCMAEEGDMEGFRCTLKMLELPEDRAAAMAFGAAALKTFVEQAATSISGKCHLGLYRAASELIDDSFQAARAIENVADRDRTLWQIVPAALLARSSEVAFLAGLMIKNPEARQQALDALSGWPPEECDGTGN